VVSNGGVPATMDSDGMTPSGNRILMLIDDEPAQQRLVSAMAGRAGWRTVIASEAEMAIAMLGTRDGMMLDAVLLDHAIPGADADLLIREIRDRRPGLPVLMLTAINSVAVAVDAMRAGASDYLVKPIAPDRLLAALEGAVSARQGGELRPLTEKISTRLGFDEIVGSDPGFRAALAVAAKAARARVPVLLEGESGVGKEVVADAIHASSSRERKPLVVLNCASIATNLIESELFGHERGAFAGAFSRHAGKLEQADGGTLFLDEIGALPAEVQIRLLRVLQTGEVQPIGARGFREVDVRIIVACDRPLIDDVAAGRFREDLYYRLAVVHVALPPLRERKGDIPALARHLLTRIGRQPGVRSLGITDGALALLASYDWPGNVRQLQTVLFRAAVLCDGDALTIEDFPDLASISDINMPVPGAAREAGITLYRADGHLRPLEDIEADVIRLAIGHYRGRMTEVARRLSIGRSTLYRKLSELGIDAA
jgi:DNA-binding NtrC family response regulator